MNWYSTIFLPWIKQSTHSKVFEVHRWRRELLPFQVLLWRASAWICVMHLLWEQLSLPSAAFSSQIDHRGGRTNTWHHCCIPWHKGKSMVCSHHCNVLWSQRSEALLIQVLAHRELELLELPAKDQEKCSMAPHSAALHMAIGDPHFENGQNGSHLWHLEWQALLEVPKPVNHQISKHFPGISLACWPAHALNGLSGPCLLGCLSGCPSALVQYQKQSLGRPCEGLQSVKLDMKPLDESSGHLLRVG